MFSSYEFALEDDDLLGLPYINEIWLQGIKTIIKYVG
jgi:hypothetical protein